MGAGDSPHAFAFAELTSIHAWVSLLADAFPGKEEGGPDIHLELVELRSRLNTTVHRIQEAKGQGALCVDEWRQFLVPLREAFDRIRTTQMLPSLCRTDTCRVWSLLHTLSIAGVARARHADVSNLPPTIQNDQGFDVMKSFLERYFTCSYCRAHFLESFKAGFGALTKARLERHRILQSGGGGSTMLWLFAWHKKESARWIDAGRRQMSERCWSNTSYAVGQKEVDQTKAAYEGSIAAELVRHYWPAEADASSLEAES